MEVSAVHCRCSGAGPILLGGVCLRAVSCLPCQPQPNPMTLREALRSGKPSSFFCCCLQKGPIQPSLLPLSPNPTFLSPVSVQTLSCLLATAYDPLFPSLSLCSYLLPLEQFLVFNSVLPSCRMAGQIGPSSLPCLPSRRCHGVLLQ